MLNPSLIINYEYNKKLTRNMQVFLWKKRDMQVGNSFNLQDSHGDRFSTVNVQLCSIIGHCSTTS